MTITTGRRDALRARLGTLLTDTCVISRPTRTYTDSGGWTDAYATVATVDCRVNPVGQIDVIRAGRIAEDADGVVTLPAETDIRGADRITVGGVTYEATAPPIPRTLDLVTRVFVTRTR